jgi:50S ribosomal protein L16 3-hydroxylase
MPAPSTRSPAAAVRPSRGRDPRCALLGGRSARAFLRGFWHKEALLVRAARPGVAGLFTAAELKALALRDDVESRLVVRDGAHWSFVQGPFRRSDFRRLPARDWTLLVQGVNLHSAPADALLREFAFLPYARLDDLMVSYAAPGGGVGPHFDSYDVFLLQGFGRRRWRYGPQRDLALRPGLPVKILRRFKPACDEILAPGDMLYLPPQFAHDGVAVDACTTYSIGFRAASIDELAAAFLDFLRDRIDLPGRYADPDLAPTREPARVGARMRDACARELARLRWNVATVARFLGCWLSEPKPTVFFDPPQHRLPQSAFARAAARRGLRLDRRTQLLYDDGQLYVNGSALDWPQSGAAALRRLANDRALPAAAVPALPPACVELLHQWYCDGYLAPDSG